MPSTRDLMTAISGGNVDRVQELLMDRDPRGIPRVDINNGFGNAETALLWALWCNPINELIVQTLLDVCDNANNPVSDINRQGPHGQTALSFVLRRSVEPNLRGRLLQRILDVRGANGELVTDVTADDCNIPLLIQAQELNDIHCFRILRDVRTSTGAFALDINEIRHGETVLDSALEDGIFYRRDRTMIQTIQQLGGLRAADVRREQEERRQQQPAQPPMVARQEHRVPQQRPMNDNQNQEAHQFINNIQNTHKSEVTVSVAASIKKLKIRYSQINILEVLQEIRNCLTQLSDSNTKKVYTINCLDRIERDPTEHALSNGTTLSQALALVWTGIKDPAALVEGLEELTEQDIECRKVTLIDNLFQAQTEYGHGGGGVSACFVGTLNKIIETLDRSHPDVTIITGSSTIVPVATARARVIVRDELKKKSPREQRKILKSWDDPEPTMATEFRENMVEIANGLLTEEFQQLLTKLQRDEITGAFEYLPRPTVHEQLDKLIATINQLHDDDNPSRQAAIIRLKEQANHLYDESDRTLQEEYELFLNTYNSFIQLDRYVVQINSLEEGDSENIRKTTITELKKRAHHSYSDRGKSFQTELDSLRRAVNIEAFKNLDEACLKILKIDDDANNPKRQACIQRLKARAYIAYSNQATSFTEALQNLNDDINLSDFFQLDKLINVINQLHDNQSTQAIVRLKEQANNFYEDGSKTFSEMKISLKMLLEVTVDEILNEFEKKIDAIGIHHVDANRKAEELLTTLRNYKNQALQAPSTESLALFAKQSKKAINEATPILQRDLGWGDYLVNLTKQLVNVVTIALAFVVTLGASNHHGFFALKPSDAVNNCQDLDHFIQSFSIR